MDSLPATRKDAMALGAKRYFTGKPCKHGHVAARYSCDAKCVGCARASYGRWAADNPERVRARHARWVAANPERRRANSARWAAANPEKCRAVYARWAADNPERVLSKMASFRARQQSYECGCCDNSDFVEIYRVAKQNSQHVDHIIPLSAGGPHCILNVQLLDPAENIRKSNRYRKQDWVDLANKIIARAGAS